MLVINGQYSISISVLHYALPSSRIAQGEEKTLALLRHEYMFLNAANKCFEEFPQSSRQGRTPGGSPQNLGLEVRFALRLSKLQNAYLMPAQLRPEHLKEKRELKHRVQRCDRLTHGHGPVRVITAHSSAQIRSAMASTTNHFHQ